MSLLYHIRIRTKRGSHDCAENCRERRMCHPSFANIVLSCYAYIERSPRICDEQLHREMEDTTQSSFLF